MPLPGFKYCSSCASKQQKNNGEMFSCCVCGCGCGRGAPEHDYNKCYRHTLALDYTHVLESALPANQSVYCAQTEIKELEIVEQSLMWCDSSWADLNGVSQVGWQELEQANVRAVCVWECGYMDEDDLWMVSGSMTKHTNTHTNERSVMKKKTPTESGRVFSLNSHPIGLPDAQRFTYSLSLFISPFLSHFSCCSVFIVSHSIGADWY